LCIIEKKFSNVLPLKKRLLRFTAFIHSIRYSKIKLYDFSEKICAGFVDSSTKYLELWEISQVFCIVIHRHNDEGKIAARWQKLRKSGTMGLIKKRSSCHGDQVHRRTIRQR